MHCSNSMRDKFAQLHISISALNLEHYLKLHSMLSQALPASGLFEGQFRMDVFDTARMRHLTCSAGYFSGREAISFNESGFIGFAGWASSTNCEPIYVAFSDWVQWLAGIGFDGKAERN